MLYIQYHFILLYIIIPIHIQSARYTPPVYAQRIYFVISPDAPPVTMATLPRKRSKAAVESGIFERGDSVASLLCAWAGVLLVTADVFVESKVVGCLRNGVYWYDVLSVMVENRDGGCRYA